MKVLVFGLIGVANVLAAFAEGGTAIDVAAGQTNVITTSTVVDGNAEIHGTLIIDGTSGKVRVTPVLDSPDPVVVRLGNGAGDDARLEIKGDAKMLAGEIKNDPYDVQKTQKISFSKLDVGSAEGRGYIEVSGTGSDAYTGWCHLAYGLLANQIRVIGVGPQPSTDTVVDLLRVNGNANTIVGTQSGWWNSSANPVRILMNGGRIGGYQGPMFCAGKWIVESEDGNDMMFWNWWGNGKLLDPATQYGSTYQNTKLELRGVGGVILGGSSSTYTWLLTTNIVWNQMGDLTFDTSAGAKLADDYALSKVQTNGRHVIFKKSDAVIDLNGHRETLNGFQPTDFKGTGKCVVLRDSASVKGRFELGSDDPEFQLDSALFNCFVRDATCLPILKVGQSPMTFPDGYSVADFPLDWSDGRITVSNGYHWIKFGKTKAVDSYPEGERDLSSAFVDNLSLAGGELVVRRGALVSTNLNLAAGVGVHVYTNSAIRMQAKGVRSEKFVRFVFKEARNPKYWIHLRTLRLFAVDNSEQFFQKNYTHNATATEAKNLNAGEYMFNPDALWTDGLAQDMVIGKDCNTYYKCDDMRFSKTDDWGGICMTNSIPSRTDASTWNVITIRLKDDAKPLVGYVIDSNWTFHYFPYCWEVLVSADGETWTTVDERTDYAPYEYSSHNPDTDELGGTYEGYRTYNNAIAKPQQAFHWTKDVDPSLVRLALNGAKLRVDCGGILDASLTDGASEVSSLEVDAALGLGTFKNVSFAENGSINVLATGRLKGKTNLFLTLENCTGAANLANWSVKINGEADSTATVEWADGNLTLRMNRGMCIFVR